MFHLFMFPNKASFPYTLFMYSPNGPEAPHTVTETGAKSIHTPPLRYEPHMYRRYAKNKKSGSRPALPPIRLYLLITISCSPYRETLEVTGVYGTCETPPPPSRFAHTTPARKLGRSPGRVALDDCYGKTLSSPPLIQYGDKPTPQKGEIVTCTLQPLTIKHLLGFFRSI